MKQIKVVPSWAFSDSEGNQLNPQLFDLLRELHDSGKLTDATKKLGISYRHGWNLIQRWAEFFGTPLVDMQKGRGASLTNLGEKLLWAEERVLARLGPQMESLASELNLEIHQALHSDTPVINLYASHGYAVALLPKLVNELQLNIQYMPSVEGIAAVERGECQVAGFHLPTQLAGSEIYANFKELLANPQLRVIRFITRQQGLMVTAGNPKQIRSLKDLSRDDVRFVNRQVGSGTSALLEELLKREQVDAKQIRGFTTREFTHSAIAAYVASGMADTGLGVEPPARQFSLDFIAVASEHYLLICLEETLANPAMQRFLSDIRSERFTDSVGTLPGYSCDHSGEVIEVHELFEELEM
jgi:putative molybdopterin biosynthesis protein